MRKYLGLILIPILLLAGCGGGGSSSSGSGGGGGPPPPPTQVITPPGAPNVEQIYVDGFSQTLASPAVNTPYVTLEVCVPSTSTCQTIDHIEVDTGSVGLRIIASALTITLPAQTSTGAPGGNPLAECLQFADGSSWGSVNTADVTMPISGEKAPAVNVQVIGAASAGTVTNAECSGTAENTVQTFGANGILGIGPFSNDCDSAGPCFPGSQAANYWECPSPSTCAAFPATQAQQLQNPVILFATDNNGSIIELPAVGSSGAATVTGSLVFGINTQTDNTLAASVTELQADPQSGFLSATLNGKTYSDSYLDSGSNGNFYTDSLTVCPGGPTATTGFYCPTSTVSESATMTSTVSNNSLAANFSVANADTLFNNNPTFTAFSNLAGTNADPSSLDLGLPFFFGINIYTGIENNGSQPFFAY